MNNEQSNFRDLKFVDLIKNGGVGGRALFSDIYILNKY